MAVSATVKVSPWAGRLCVMKEVDITLDASGDGNTIVNLDRTFVNAPSMLVVPPLGSAGTYEAVYDSATPKITVGTDVSGGASESVAGFQSKTVTVVLVAIDPE